MKKFNKPILAFLTFIFVQLIVSFIIGIIMVASNPEIMKSAMAGDNSSIQSALSNSSMLSLSLIFSSLLTILVIYSMKMIRFREAFSVKGFNIRVVLIAFLAACTGIYATDILSEVLNLPNIIAEQISNMSGTIPGLLAICIVGPICEEIVFRESITGWLLRKSVKPWIAIAFSSLLFGIVHFNPAQIPFAFLVGLILGYIYYRTGSLVIVSLLHIANNSMSCWLGNTMGNDFSLIEQIGSTSAVISCIVCALLSIAFLRTLNHITPTPQFSEEISSEQEVITEK